MRFLKGWLVASQFLTELSRTERPHVRLSGCGNRFAILLVAKRNEGCSLLLAARR